MRTIGSVNGMALPGANGNMKADSVSRNIQNQIMDAQKRLQEISSNKGLTPEEKMKKKQEIQQEISTLNQQLRQHQVEQRQQQAQRRQQQSSDSSTENMLDGRRENSGKSGGMSQAGMQAIISADSSMKQARVQGSVAAQMKGRAEVLKAEIKQDAGRGMDTKRKEEELADVQKKAQAAQISQTSTLAQANKIMEEAAKDGGKKQKEKADGAEENERAGMTDIPGNQDRMDAKEVSENKTLQTADYTPVDIRL